MALIDAEREALVNRITAYLAGGGLVNPEMAIHNRVRDLLVDCRLALAAVPSLAGERERIYRDELDRILAGCEYAVLKATERGDPPESTTMVRALAASIRHALSKAAPPPPEEGA